jgi:hypothetical protein
MPTRRNVTSPRIAREDARKRADAGEREETELAAAVMELDRNVL